MCKLERRKSRTEREKREREGEREERGVTATVFRTRRFRTTQLSYAAYVGNLPNLMSHFFLGGALLLSAFFACRDLSKRERERESFFDLFQGF